jgi:glycosyltransferase involved in cell wall biosynthesis
MSAEYGISLGHVGVVAIGRNEGERLKRCLASVPAGVGAVVYVDSGSTDGSIEHAESLGVVVVRLDTSVPFTAARARNAGFEALEQRLPNVQLVQFVDGDCQLAEGWISAAVRALSERADVAAVWGRRREVAPERSVYNRLCDFEWGQAPVGESDVFGGDVLLRVTVFRQLGGYNPALIAGEDPELALRVRRAEHRILRIDAEMTRHDAAMTSVQQWWMRAKRAGYAYAQVSELHANEAERFWVDDRRRALVWGAAVPLVAAGLSVPTLGLSTALLGLYPLRALRIAQRERAQGQSNLDAGAWAINCVAASIPQAVGILKYHAEHLTGTTPKIIEYKHHE